MNNLHTTKEIAERLKISSRGVLVRAKSRGLVPFRMVGRSALWSDYDAQVIMGRIEKKTSQVH